MPSSQASKALYIPDFSGFLIATLWNFSFLLGLVPLTCWVKVGRAFSCDTFSLELLFNLGGLIQQILHLNIFL